MAGAPSCLAISVDLCPSVCEQQPLYVQRPTRKYLSPRPDCAGNFDLDQPGWCARPSNLMKLEELSTNRVFNVGEKPFYIIGRNEKADIVLDSLYVSRRHAALLHHTNGGSYIMDLGSVHGTYLGKERIIPYVPTLVKPGILIQFGPCHRQFLLKECPPMAKVIQQAQQLQKTGDDRDVLINTQLNCFLSYQETEGFTNDIIPREAIFRRDTLENLPFGCEDSSSSSEHEGSHSRCHSETSDDSSELEVPARKRVRFVDEMDDSTSSDDSRGLAL